MLEDNTEQASKEICIGRSNFAGFGRQKEWLERRNDRVTQESATVGVRFLTGSAFLLPQSQMITPYHGVFTELGYFTLLWSFKGRMVKASYTGRCRHRGLYPEFTQDKQQRI